jgi:protease IV
MAINADTLLDRLYLKSQITRWRMLAVAFGVIALLVVVGRHSQHSPIEKDFVARLTIDGFIGDDQELYTLIEDVAGNPKAKAVIVWLDTPGGSAVGGEETYFHLRKLAEKKPVVAVMRSIATSAGYMIALGTDQIFAREGTITGSIGVIIETAEVTDLAEKLGIKPIVIKSAPLKGVPSPVEKSTPEAEKTIKDVVNDFYGRFIDMVAERRKLPRDTAVTLADGRVYSGKAAVGNKLIDAIGGEQEALKYLTEKRQIRSGLDVRDVKIEKENSVFQELMGTVAGKIFQRSSVTLDGLVAVWHPSLH